jgi:hypothetical protein
MILPEHVHFMVADAISGLLTACAGTQSSLAQEVTFDPYPLSSVCLGQFVEGKLKVKEAAR